MKDVCLIYKFVLTVRIISLYIRKYVVIEAESIRKR